MNLTLSCQHHLQYNYSCKIICKICPGSRSVVKKVSSHFVITLGKFCPRLPKVCIIKLYTIAISCLPVVSQSVCRCQSLSPQSNIFKQGQELTISEKKLCKAPALGENYQTRVKVTDSDKHSSLLLYGINYDRKRFCDLDPRLPLILLKVS